jgi:hypothetical protein
MQHGTFAPSFSCLTRTDIRNLSALSSLSFGALRKAQRTLDRTQGDSDAGSDSDGSYSTEDQRLDDSSGGENKQEDKLPMKKVPKNATTVATGRKSKHA